MGDTLRYIKLDYASHRDALYQRVRARWPRVWNDLLANSFGAILLDLVAYATSTLAFTINRLAGESFIPTMTLRESAVRLGALVGYQLRGPIAATVLCEAELPSATADDVTIAAKATIRVGTDSLSFEVTRDYLIEAGKLSPDELVLTISADLTGQNVVSTNVVVTGGSEFVELVDTTVDLTQLVKIGQIFRPLPATSSQLVYVITAISAAPGAISYNRLTIEPAWEGYTLEDPATAGVQEELAAEVRERRLELSHGQTISDRFVTPAQDSPRYAVKLSRQPVIQGSVTVAVNGDPWTLVDDLALHDGLETVAQLRTFPTGETMVEFGDGVSGSLVLTEAEVIVEYRTGGGLIGNIQPGEVSNSITAITDIGALVSVSLTNLYAAGQGGRDAETLGEARSAIPAYTKTNNRAVTLGDYQTLAQLFTDPTHGSVAFARSSVRTENSLLEGNIVIIYAWTSGPGGSLVALQPPLKQALQDYLQLKAVGTDYVLVADGTTRPAPVSLRFKMLGGFDLTTTQLLVQDTVSAAVSALTPGSSLIYSDLVRSIDEVRGVDHVDVATPTSDLPASNPTELLTPPDEDHDYELERLPGVLANEFICQLPASPLRAWSLRLFIGTEEVSVIPDIIPRSARLVGAALLSTPKSTINLLTGEIRFYTTSSSEVRARIITVGGYDRERVINIYVGYLGDISLAKRREIRASIRAWGEELAVGSTVFASAVTGLNASLSNITDVVEAIDGVTEVTHVAVDSPASVADRVVVLATELPRLGEIVLNSTLD